MTENSEANDTRGEWYADRLTTKSDARWKQVLDVQRPYRWNLRRQELGRTLDVGCGVGRNLRNLPAGSVGVDHNSESIRRCRAEGLTAYDAEQWLTAPERVEGHFDGMLLAHVIEHIPESAWVGVLEEYLPYLRPGGKLMFICPQERGYASDSTHVRFATGKDLVDLARTVGLDPQPWRSFPLPRWTGKYFTHNEFNVVATKPA